jgi:hypothetical protein
VNKILTNGDSNVKNYETFEPSPEPPEAPVQGSAAGKFFKNLNNNVWNNVTNNRITQFYQFHGCFWHGCPHCYELEQFTPHRVHKGTDIPMKFGDLYAYTQHMTERYKAAGYQVKEGNVNGMNLPR